jgi:hypothetical protein
MEDNLKILKAEYLSNHLWDQTQILSLSLYDQTLFGNPLNEDDLQWKATSNGRRPPTEEDLQWKMTSKY